MKKLLLAELLGTFILVFAGCGAIVVNDLFGGAVGHLGICVVFGLVVMAIIYTFGNVSGAHINPAVTIGLWAAGRFKGALAAPYISAQLAGATLAALVLRLLFPEHATLGATLPAIDLGRAFLLEVLISFMLMATVLAPAGGPKVTEIMAGATIGGMVALAALMAGPVTGASMNPARSFGPALVSLNLDSLWLYFTAPVLGMLLAVSACRAVQGPDCCPGPGADD